MKPETRKGTCETCGRSRKLWRCGDGYRWRCSECRVLSAEEREAKRGEREARTRARTLAKKKAYPVIGGPLDGEHALTVDFESGWRSETPGMYYHLRDEYAEYNASSRSSQGPSMIFVHTSLLRPAVPGRAR